MGSNGQFDEIALIMFFEDNPEFQDKPIKDWLEPSNKYIKQLQINYDNKDKQWTTHIIQKPRKTFNS